MSCIGTSLSKLGSSQSSLVSEKYRSIAIESMLHCNKSVCNIPDRFSKLPLHLAIERRIKWNDGLSAIALKGDPRTMKSRNPHNGLYPFMAAAVCGKSSDLNAIYSLLKEGPELSTGLPLQQQ